VLGLAMCVGPCSAMVSSCDGSDLHFVRGPRSLCLPKGLKLAFMGVSLGRQIWLISPGGDGKTVDGKHDRLLLYAGAGDDLKDSQGTHTGNLDTNVWTKEGEFLKSCHFVVNKFNRRAAEIARVAVGGWFNSKDWKRYTWGGRSRGISGTVSYVDRGW
jgi:hypothetical protein